MRLEQNSNCDSERAYTMYVVESEIELIIEAMQALSGDSEKGDAVRENLSGDDYWRNKQLDTSAAIATYLKHQLEKAHRHRSE